MKKLLTAAFVFAAASAFAATGVTHREATNIAESVVAAATNGFARVDGAARPLPKYLHRLTLDDTYPEEAARYYEQADSAVAGGCSARRSGTLLERNYDWSYDESASFVLSVGSSRDRFASIGVASAGTNLTERIVTSGRWSRYYKVLPGRTLDGINENGVVCEINVVATNGSPWETRTKGRDLNAIGAVRWALDHATGAGAAAQELAKRVYIPESMKRLGYSAHFMVADADGTWIVEDGVARQGAYDVMTNYRLFTKDDPYGTGYERAKILSDGGGITDAWFREAYRRPFARPTEFAAPGVGTHDETEKLLAWAEANVPAGAPESLTRNGRSWQTVHTSVYDIERKTLKVAVQETDDWYVFALGKAGMDEARVREIADAAIEESPRIAGHEDALNGLNMSVQELYGSRDYLDGRLSTAEARLDYEDARIEAACTKEEAYAKFLPMEPTENLYNENVHWGMTGGLYFGPYESLWIGANSGTLNQNDIGDFSWITAMRRTLQDALDEKAGMLATTPIPLWKEDVVSYLNPRKGVNEDQDGSVVIGKGASGTVPLEEIEKRTVKTILRSEAVAIGHNAAVEPVPSIDQVIVQGVAIGWNARASGNGGVAIGAGAQHWDETPMEGGGAYASGNMSFALGYGAKATATGATQIGAGENAEAGTLKFKDWKVVGSDGRIPLERLPVEELRAALGL